MSQMAKIAITIDSDVLKRLDTFVADKTFKNRSQAIQAAVNKVLEKMEHSRLKQECKKLDVNEEISLADEGLKEDFDQWPDY